MSESTRSPAWQTSLNPALVQRLHRDAGIISQALARRILGWAAYFSRRTGDFVELLQKRGHVGDRRASEVPIVHAHWSEEQERVWPTAAPSPVVVVVQARPSMEDRNAKASPGRADAPGLPAIKAAPANEAAARASSPAPAPIGAAPRAREISSAAIPRPALDGAPPAPRVALTEIEAAPTTPSLAATEIEPARPEIVKASMAETPASTPLVDTVSPVPPRAHGTDLTPELPPAPAGHRTIAGRADAPGAVVIQLPPARRVVRGAGRHRVSPTDSSSPPRPGPLAEQRPRGAASARAPESPLPGTIAQARPSPPPMPPVLLHAAPRGVEAAEAPPASRPTPLVLVTQRPRVSSIVTHADPSLPLVAGARRSAPALPVEARYLRPSPSREAIAPSVAPRGAPTAVRSSIVHAGQSPIGDAPRRQEPTTPEGHRPRALTRSPLEATPPPPSPGPALEAEGPSAPRPPRRELDIDTVVEKVERRILKNLAVERERKGVVG